MGQISWASPINQGYGDSVINEDLLNYFPITNKLFCTMYLSASYSALILGYASKYDHMYLNILAFKVAK